MYHLRTSLLIVLCIITNRALAQDHIYAQQYMMPLYLNPALAGTGENDFRVNAIMRNQYTNIPGGMYYFSAGIDKYKPSLNGGIGLLATGSYEGFIRRINVSGIYSFQVCNDDWELRVGLQAGATQRKIDYGKLIFSDQLDNTGINGLPTSADLPIYSNRWFPDFGSGAVFFYRNLFMASLSANHVNTPDESFTSNTESKLPVRWNFSGRYMYEMENWYLVPGFSVYKQAGNTSWSLGVECKSHYINLGLNYRSNVDFHRNNEVVVSLTFDNFLGSSNGGSGTRIGLSGGSATGQFNVSRAGISGEAAFEHQWLTDDALSAENRCRAGYSNRGSTNCYRIVQ